ncbi:SDR family oxidoreductase [Pseudomonas sp. ZM23]|uniref:SDR family oxidoreductase n=1 Tax=Pseudomonas triclosanedens TaxID=2961893 RepID=A0ABY6ZUP9_9PSED|nr:SDR family oxidoreductase [Pseudomonas triclosanedens]MCP8463280.1 SDR family oxidoreductase [Pseudomonas triclosanedens]MCP8469661.1 SDR family oxidoreductase [Pseudomonas triclosanedens]MCP8474082.1 SDR family oxidoreductase [Pseudomonas triclosanedens]WAI48524.1 SDR family oxidoreductase [Pseudomonas triclosanedens]
MSQPVVLITGCSSGIGRALAEVFQGAGYQVWATARRDEDVAALDQAGFRGVLLDVNDEAAVERLAEQVQREAGGLDVLVNNAGYGAMGPLLDGGSVAIRKQFETNVFAVVGMTRALFPALRARRGLVVNIGSVSGVLVTPFAGAYCASKAAVHALNDALRLELAPFGIDVMEVQPGAIASNFGANASREMSAVISESSAWWPLRTFIQARAAASQDNPTPASDFARQLLAAVQRSPRPRLVRIGNGSRALPLLARWMPTGLMDKVLKKRFGLNGQL